jgi:phytoene synthase
MQDMFRTRARTFWFAARFLPADRRQAVGGLYAFARAIDDLVDEPAPALTTADVSVTLSAWRRWLDEPTRLTPPDCRLAAGVAPALCGYGIPPAYLQMLVDGVSSDLTRGQMGSWAELRQYCVQVASSIGLAMCHLLGAGDDPVAREAAVDLGIAMQLTNILRDVGSDLRAGRVYLPLEDLVAHDLSPEWLTAAAARVSHGGSGGVTDDFRAFMREQIERARAHYASGLEGVSRLPTDCRLAILLAGRLYRAILDDIERADYDVFSRRAATSARYKAVEAMRLSLAMRQPARLAPARPRAMAVQR